MSTPSATGALTATGADDQYLWASDFAAALDSGQRRPDWCPAWLWPHQEAPHLAHALLAVAAGRSRTTALTEQVRRSALRRARRALGAAWPGDTAAAAHLGLVQFGAEVAVTALAHRAQAAGNTSLAERVRALREGLWPRHLHRTHWVPVRPALTALRRDHPDWAHPRYGGLRELVRSLAVDHEGRLEPVGVHHLLRRSTTRSPLAQTELLHQALIETLERPYHVPGDQP